MNKQLKLNRLSKRLDKAFSKINRGVNRYENRIYKMSSLSKRKEQILNSSL